ncbi:hypothetical protein KY333_05465, partial [Candidatus Woesearchaeota archaeon]|nr:hypothetical protein [Candidatus Woesearchaeota archaeon]
GLQQLGNMVVRLQRQLGQGSNTSPVEPQRHHHHHSATKNKRKQKPRQSEPRSVPQATPAPQAQQSAGIGGLMNMMMGGIPKVEKATPAPGPVTFPPPHQDSDDSGEETYDDKDLDEELETEYEQLNTERKENCEGDTCKLMD